MKKVIKLTEADLNKLIQKVLMETVGEEPILDKSEHDSAILWFEEGKTFPSYDNEGNKLTKQDFNEYVNDLAEGLSKNTETIQTLQKFYNNPKVKIPKFIYIQVGTSHTGTGETNAAVAQGRIDFFTNLIMKAFVKIGLDSAMAKRFIVSNTNAKYKPSTLDKNFYNPKNIPADKMQRFGYIGITPLVTRGLNTSGIQDVQKGLNKASSSFFNNFLFDGVEETVLVRNIKKLETYSDIQDLNNAINAGGKWDSLEEFLNDQLFDDPTDMKQVANHLKKVCVASQKQPDTVRLISASGGIKISIGLNN
jgi:hypothetical protein